MKRRIGHALRRRYGQYGHAFPRSDPRPESWTKETVTGTLTGVEATGGYLTLDVNGHKSRVEFKNSDYHATGSSGRAYHALLNLKKFVGRQVTAEVTYHSAFGWTIFGRRSIKVH